MAESKVRAVRTTTESKNAIAAPMNRWMSLVLQQLAADPDDVGVRAIVAKAREEGLLL